MKNKLIMAGIAMLALAISSCDEDTDTMGYTLTSESDRYAMATDTFLVNTRSIIADSVLSRSAYSFLGRIKDPETGTDINCDYMTQFVVLENEADKIFPVKDSLLSIDAAGLPIADSVTVSLVVESYQGDSLAAMKLNLTELDHPVEENRTYYTNFDPEAEGYLREGGLSQNKLYSMADLTQTDSARNAQRTSYYYAIKIALNKPYTDKKGNTYNNYGTYLMRTYYEHPEYFKNSFTFTKNVCPGFYFKTTDGLGVMSKIMLTQLNVHYRYKWDGVFYSRTRRFNGTEEVLQTTHIVNDKKNIQRLVNNNECTYLKTPAGIFTEVTLPIDDIKRGHENDTITSAKIIFKKMTDYSDLSDILLEEPNELLMVERDSLYSFFEKNKQSDNLTSFLATYSSQYHMYTYSNISSLVNHMYKIRNQGSPNWNKVVLIPVESTSISSSSYYTSTSTVTSMSNDMSITSIRLVGGSANKHEPVTISVIYNKQAK